MTDFERFERRLAAVERALTERDRPVRDVPEKAALADDVDSLEDRIDDLVDRIADLEGSTQAVRGYVGKVRSVNEGVERRADSAVATVDRLERRVEALEESTAEPDTMEPETAEPETAEPETTVRVSDENGRSRTRLKHTREQRETTYVSHGSPGDSSAIDHQWVETHVTGLSMEDGGRAMDGRGSAMDDGGSAMEKRGSATGDSTAADPAAFEGSPTVRDEPASEPRTAPDGGEGTGNESTRGFSADHTPGTTLFARLRRILR